ETEPAPPTGNGSIPLVGAVLFRLRDQGGDSDLQSEQYEDDSLNDPDGELIHSVNAEPLPNIAPDAELTPEVEIPSQFLSNLDRVPQPAEVLSSPEYTTAVVRVIERARHLAASLNQTELGIEHLVIALTFEPDADEGLKDKQRKWLKFKEICI